MNESKNMTDADRAAIAQNVRHTKAVNIGRILARIVKTVHPSAESLARRKRLEPHLAVWLRHYFPEVFFWKHGPVQLLGISKLEQCINEGGCFCVVWPRGDGKSVVGKGKGGSGKYELSGVVTVSCLQVFCCVCLCAYHNAVGLHHRNDHLVTHPLACSYPYMQ